MPTANFSVKFGQHVTVFGFADYEVEDDDTIDPDGIGVTVDEIRIENSPMVFQGKPHDTMDELILTDKLAEAVREAHGHVIMAICVTDAKDRRIIR